MELFKIDERHYIYEITRIIRNYTNYTKRHELRKLSNQKHRDPLNPEIRDGFHKTLHDYKKLLDSKRKEFQEKKTLQLDELALNPDKASFWNCSKSMNDTIDEKAPAPISEETWLDHFQSLHSKTT